MSKWKEEFKEERAKLMKEKWADPEYRQSQMKAQKQGGNQT